MIEPAGPESPGRRHGAAPGRIKPSALLASVLAAAVVGGAVASGVTLGVLRLQARTNQQTVDLGSRVTISEDTAAIQVALKTLPAVASVVDGRTARPRGSAFVVTSDGYLVTNVTVVANVKDLGVLVGSETRRRDARLVDYDCQTGVAVLKVDGVGNLPTLAFGDSSSLRVGQNVIALGGVLGEGAGVTRAAVSALHQVVLVPDPLGTGGEAELADVILTDRPMEPSASGGPLLNVGGQVVGVTMAMAGRQAFALAANDIQPEVQRIVQGGQLTVPSLGVQAVTVSEAEAALRGLSAGARLVSVDPGGPAQAAGLNVGDVVIQVDDQKIDDAHPLAQVLLSRFRPGQRVTITFSRGSATQQVQLTLAEARPTCQ